MKVTLQDKELIDSQTFLAFGLGETRISLTRDTEAVTFILNFIQEEGEGAKQEKITLESSDVGTLKINLSNWNNTLGTTLISPLEVGTFQHRKLYILFFIKKAGSQGQVREVTFSIYLGEEVQGG